MLATCSMCAAASIHGSGTSSCLHTESALPHFQVFQGRVVEGDPNQCGHIICTVAGSGPNKQTINYSTERVVGNGSFGVVFQATCLESGETVRSLRPMNAFDCVLFTGQTPRWG